jgi:PAS domain S-box-containing protein
MTTLPKVSIILISYLLGTLVLAAIVLIWQLSALLLITLIAPIYYVAMTGTRWVTRAMLLTGVITWLLVSVVLVDHSSTTIITELVVILAIIVSTELLSRQATARRMAELRAEQEAQRYRRLSDLTTDYVYSIRFNQHGEMINEWISSAFTRITGYTVEELGSHGIWEQIYPPEDVALTYSRHTEALAGNSAVNEYRLRTRDGSIRWMRGYMYPERGEDGRVVRIIGAAQDITRERSAEEQLRRQNAYLAALHETSLGLLNRLDLNDLLEALILRASQLLNAENGFLYFEDLEQQVVEMKVATGVYTRYQGRLLRPDKGAAGKSWYHQTPIVLDNYADWPERLDDPELDQIGALITMPLVSGKRAIGTLGVSTCDKSRRFTAAEVEVIERFSELAVMALDNARLYGDARREIAARRQAEDALRREQNLFIGGPVVVFKWNAAPGWPVEYVSPNIAQFGYTASDFTSGKLSYRQFVYPEDRDRVASEVNEYAKTDLQYFEQDYRIVSKDGQARWIYDYTVMMRNEAGVITHYDGYIMDVTERKQSEHVHQEFQEQLRESQRLESLGLLAGGVAHDFNNMLATIMGNAGLALLDVDEQHPAYESVKQIEIAALHAATLTRQLLAYAGKGRFLIQLIGLNKLIEEIATLLQASVTRKHQLILKLAPDLPAVMADTAQMTQVVMNLIVNASEAIGDAPGTITIRTHYHSTYVMLEVNDTGNGMDEATLARIFEPFFTTKFVGRGLGLSAVQGIVRGHNGTIQVQSHIGTGTTFTISLPSAVPTIPPAEAPLTPQPQPAALTRQTVLVVDDEEYIRVLIQRILERNGLTVLLAESGRQAIEIFQQQAATIGIVLLDLTMPQMSGEQTLQQLMVINPDVPIILMSGYSQYELDPSLKDNARVRFLAKPFTPLDLVQLAESVISQQYVKVE